MLGADKSIEREKPLPWDAKKKLKGRSWVVWCYLGCLECSEIDCGGCYTTLTFRQGGNRLTFLGLCGI